MKYWTIQAIYQDRAEKISFSFSTPSEVNNQDNFSFSILSHILSPINRATDLIHGMLISQKLELGWGAGGRLGLVEI